MMVDFWKLEIWNPNNEVSEISEFFFGQDGLNNIFVLCLRDFLSKTYDPDGTRMKVEMKP